MKMRRFVCKKICVAFSGSCHNSGTKTRARAGNHSVEILKGGRSQRARETAALPDYPGSEVRRTRNSGKRSCPGLVTHRRQRMRVNGRQFVVIAATGGNKLG